MELVNNFYFTPKGGILQKVSDQPWVSEYSFQLSLNFFRRRRRRDSGGDRRQRSGLVQSGMTSSRTENARANMRVHPQGDEGGVLFFLEIADLIETCVGLVYNFYFTSKGESWKKYRINLGQVNVP